MNKFFIVDSVDREILVYENNLLVDSYNTDFATYIRDIKVHKDVIYLLDESDSIFTINTKNKLVNNYKLSRNIEAYRLTGLSVNEKMEIVYQDDLSEYSLSGERTIGHTYNGIDNRFLVENDIQNISSSSGANIYWKTKNSSAQVLGVDDFGNTYISVIEEVPDSALVLLELTIRKYNDMNEEIGIFRVPLENCVSFPLRHTVITNSGDAYIMLVKTEGVSIEKIDFTTKFVTQMPQLEKKAENYDRNIDKLNVQRFAAPTRTTVYNRASAMINLLWIRNASNMINPSPSTVTMPSYLERYGPGVSFVGIPYTWAGFDGIDTTLSSNWNSYSSAMAYGAFAGNINASGNYKSGTAGLDCSGFVSSAIQLGYKTNTTGLSNLSRAVAM